MKKLFLVLVLLLICSPSFAIPLGGQGSNRYNRETGIFEVVGTLSVEGITRFGRQNYVWPITPEAGTTILSNTIVGNKGMIKWIPQVMPSGTNGSLQFNNAGTFQGDAALAWDATSKNLMINGAAASVNGHTHSAADIKAGILSPANGGTGSNNGSINALGELKLAAGGVNQNVTISPSGTGYAAIGGSGLISSGIVRSETGYNVKGTDGTSGILTEVTDIRLNGSVLQKKIRQITVTGGIITSLSAESDWMDAGGLAPTKP